MRKVAVATTIMSGHDHVSGLERLRGPVTVIRRCESLAELISVGRSGLADVLLVAGDTESLTLTFIESVAADARGGRPPAVAALSDVAGERERLGRLGVPTTTPETEPAALAAMLQDAVSAVGGPGPVAGPEGGPAAVVTGGTPSDADGGGRRGRRAAPQRSAAVLSAGSGPADPEHAGPDAGAVTPGVVGTSLGTSLGTDPGTDRGREPATVPPGPRDGVGRQDTDPGGPRSEDAREAGEAAGVHGDPGAAEVPPRTTAVWGPAGSPGRTTVAVNLAVELSLAGRRTLLIDLDTYAASAGVLLGLLDESAGIAQACRLADQGGIGPEGIERSAVRARVAGVTLQVLTGLTRSDRWPELRRPALDAVLGAAAEGWDEVVVDCGFSLEEDEELSFDVPAPQRNAATLAGLAAADRILAVGTGDPVGLPRLIRALDELGRVTVADGAVVEVVVNQVRADASGVAPQSQVRSVLERFGGDREVAAFLPWDRKSLDRALLGGQVLAEAAPQSGLRRSLSGLTGLGRSAPETPGRRWWARR